MLWSSSSHLVVDEAIITYRDRTLYKIKLPNKPIKEGYKVWVLGDVRYVYNWLWHSYINEPEDIPLKNLNVYRIELTDLTKSTKVHLVSTFTFILRLTERLRTVHFIRVFYFFLNNLFLNINVSQTLLVLRICCIDTTRKNVQEIPDWLIKLKQHNRDLIWNSILV